MEGLKSFSGKQTADLGLLSPLRMDRLMVEIISFKLLTKRQDICSISNVEQNMIPDVGSYVAKSLAGKTLAKGQNIWRGF